MDKTMLRNQALNVATMRAKEGATTKDILKDAEAVFAWLTKDADAPAGPSPAPASGAAQHESASVGAVKGEEPTA